MIEYKIRGNHIIATFLVASVVIHGFLLWQNGNSPSDITNGENSFTVSLNTFESFENNAVNKNQSGAKPDYKNKIKILDKKQHISDTVIYNINNPHRKTIDEVLLPDNTSHPVTSKQANLPSQKQIQKGIKNLFQANFYYPTIARRNHWQGTLEISLRILPNGQLTNIQVIKTSGYSILDTAAIDTLKTAHILPLAKDGLNGKYFDLILPIEYRLIDS